MTAATIKLIEAVERLNMTGEIDVANLHELAGLARLSLPCKSGEGAGGSEAEKWRHKLWMVACHATGGGIPEIEGVDRSVNDICVQITQSRNMIYQAGKDAALSKPDATQTREAEGRSIYAECPQHGQFARCAPCCDADPAALNARGGA